MISQDDVLKALKGVQDPDLRKDLVDLGMIKDVKVEGSLCSLTVELTTPACPLKEKMAEDIRAAITSRIKPIHEVSINWSSNVRNSFPTGHDLLPGVRNIVLVGSGKGGVGKSTIAANIACALTQSGAAVGLLDADIYGPSVPTIFALRQPPETTADQRIVPTNKYGLKLMSMGLLLEEGQPVVWRGPMLDAALKQFLGQVQWGQLDYLVIDLPPGTGDVQLSLARLVPQSAAVVVTTPQDVALADVKRALNMFRQLNIKVVGIVENMSGFICGHCGERTDIFLTGGGKRAADQFGVELLGEAPLSEQVVRLTDEGMPVVIEEPESAFSNELRSIAGKVAQWLAVESAKNPPPKSAKVDTAGGHAPPIHVPAGHHHGHEHHNHGHGQPAQSGAKQDGYTRF